MEGWGIGDIPLHGRVAQPAEMGKDKFEVKSGYIVDNLYEQVPRTSFWPALIAMWVPALTSS